VGSEQIVAARNARDVPFSQLQKKMTTLRRRPLCRINLGLTRRYASYAVWAWVALAEPLWMISPLLRRRRSRGMKLRIRSPGLTILLTTGWPTYLNISTLNNQRLIFHLFASALAFRSGFTLSS
jgi:hypothetical protein